MSDLTTTNRETAVSTIGTTANRIAAGHTFADYLSRKSANTIRTQAAALALFADYLHQVGMAAGELQTKSTAWAGITWGIVEGFKAWLLKEGYSIASVNNRLSIIKTYCKLAAKAETIPADDLQLILAVSGYSQKEAARVNEKRHVHRVGHKKADHVSLTAEQAAVLKSQPETAVGQRDGLMMCLLLDHGLRCGEVAALQVEHFDLRRGMFTFYREKVGKTQTHKMTQATARAARAYLAASGRINGRLLVGSHRDTGLTDKPMTARAITKRVAWLGKQQLGLYREKQVFVTNTPIGAVYKTVKVGTLSAHDCRHFWATDAAKNKTDAFRLRDAGGWSSLAMPSRYVEAARIANEGVVLSGD